MDVTTPYKFIGFGAVHCLPQQCGNATNMQCLHTSTQTSDAPTSTCQSLTPPKSNVSLLSLKINNNNYNLYLVFGRFPAELGPETRSNGSG